MVAADLEAMYTSSPGGGILLGMWADDITILFIADDGTVTYEVDHLDISDNHPDDVVEHVMHVFEHPQTLRVRTSEYEGEFGGGFIEIVVAAAPTIAVFASMIKTYIRRNADRTVRIGWQDGRPQLDIHGSYTIEEIERLIKNHTRPPEVEVEGPQSGL